MDPTLSESSARMLRLEVVRPPQPSPARVVTVDEVLGPATCRCLIRRADVDRWLTSTAELRAANGPHTTPPRRISEPDRPCRLVGADERPAFVALDDPVLALRLFHKLAHEIPKRIDEVELAGLGPLSRCVRYSRDEASAPHLDPIRETSRGLVSKLSLIVFLNDNFGGGALDFPPLGRKVEARAGRAVLFPHGLLHQDELVGHGRKFVLETEVFYAPDWVPLP